MSSRGVGTPRGSWHLRACSYPARVSSLECCLAVARYMLHAIGCTTHLSVANQREHFLYAHVIGSATHCEAYEYSSCPLACSCLDLRLRALLQESRSSRVMWEHDETAKCDRAWGFIYDRVLMTTLRCLCSCSWKGDRAGQQKSRKVIQAHVGSVELAYAVPHPGVSLLG
jgi:hypothetical protein